MQLSRSGSTGTDVARRRLEMLADGLDGAADEPRSGAAVDSAPPEPAAAGATGATAATSPGKHAARSLSWWSRLLARLLDSVPATMRGRWGITAQHVTVVALVVATALALAAWWVVRARPEPVSAVPVTSPSTGPGPVTSTATGPAATGPAAAATAPDGVATTAASSSAARLVVHVAGKVKRPGIVTLATGSRVIDALQKAGGARRGVDLSGLNLARPLADGEQILVGATASVPGAVPPAAPAAPGQPSTGVVNLNTATSAQLEELPGIGPVTAASILEWRAEHGRFSTVEELLEVSGIGEVTLADLRELVTV